MHIKHYIIQIWMYIKYINQETTTPQPVHPEAVNNLRLQVNGSAFHFEPRGVAIESIAFLVKVLKRVGRDIIDIAPDLTPEFIDDFIVDAKTVLAQIREDIYKSSALKLSDYDIEIISDEILKCKWSGRSNVEQNSYMTSITKELRRIWNSIGSLLDNQSLTEYPVIAVWTYVVGEYSSRILIGYSSIKKCTPEGRGNMSMDFGGLETLLIETHKLNPDLGISLSVVRNYINAYYMELNELLNFIKSNTVYLYLYIQKDYTYEQILSLVNLMKITRKEYNQFIEELKVIYNKY